MNELDMMLEELLGGTSSSAPEIYEETVEDVYEKRLSEIKEIYEDAEEAGIACDKYIQETYDSMSADGEVFFEAGIVAAALAIAGKELTSLLVKAGFDVASIGTTKALGKGAGKSLLARFSKYTILHPEIEPISKFTSKTYDLVEANSLFNTQFKLAMKWGEKINTRVAVRVFSYNDKPQFAIAYGQLSEDPAYNSEFIWLDSKFKKYSDFYTASAHAAVGIGHPSVARMVDTMKREWKEAAAQSKKVIKESCEDAYANGTIVNMKTNILKAYYEGVIDDDAFMAYTEEMDKAGLTDDTFFYEEMESVIAAFA